MNDLNNDVKYCSYPSLTIPYSGSTTECLHGKGNCVFKSLCTGYAMLEGEICKSQCRYDPSIVFEAICRPKTIVDGASPLDHQTYDIVRPEALQDKVERCLKMKAMECKDTNLHCSRFIHSCDSVSLIQKWCPLTCGLCTSDESFTR